MSSRRMIGRMKTNSVVSVVDLVRVPNSNPKPGMSPISGPIYAAARAVNTSDAPASASITAIDRPSPRLAPVTIARRPAIVKRSDRCVIQAGPTQACGSARYPQPSTLTTISRRWRDPRGQVYASLRR